jgi:hypothetical protein
MQLNNLVIDASPKTSWQCFDLGCRVALADYKTLFSYWLLLTLPIFILLISLSLQWGLLIFWLFKPWYERGLLYILSRTVFGAKVSIKQALLALPSQIKPLWFSSLTYRRLAPSRSFDMAVAQLENLSGERRTKRLKVLHKSRDDNTSWWTICCVHWESFLALASITLLQILLPAEFDFRLLAESLSVADSFENYVFIVCVFLSMAIVAPFYIAGGFVAYLNRRVILEAWDIELGFNKWRKNYLEKASKNVFYGQSRLNNQIKPKNLNPSKPSSKDILGLAFLFLISTGFLPTDAAYAQTIKADDDKVLTQIPVDTMPYSDIDKTKQSQGEYDLLDPFAAKKKEIGEDLERVLSEPPFAQREMVTKYRWILSNEDTQENEKSTSDYAFLALVVAFMASSFEIVLWLLFIFVFTYLIYRNWGNITRFFDVKTIQTDNTPLPSFISKAFKEELPDDILLVVQQAIDNQKFRRALSILVRASFTYLSKEQQILITKSMTEKECLHEIKQTCPEPIYMYMQSLLQEWMKMAWAHQLPSADMLHILKQGYADNFIQERVQTSNNTSPGNDEKHKSGVQ